MGPRVPVVVGLVCTVPSSSFHDTKVDLIAAIGSPSSGSVAILTILYTFLLDHWS